jgi:hypothetical protein
LFNPSEYEVYSLAATAMKHQYWVSIAFPGFLSLRRCELLPLWMHVNAVGKKQCPFVLPVEVLRVAKCKALRSEEVKGSRSGIFYEKTRELKQRLY